MKTFSLSHEINCDQEKFWALFFDKALNEAMFRDGLQFPHYEVLEFKETATEIVRRVKVIPKMDAPGPVAKALGSSFSYVEDGTFDKAAKVLRWKTTPSAMADKVTTRGTIKAEPAGDGKVRRVSDFEYEAKVFGIGGIIESAFEKSLRSGWDKSAEFLNRWLKEHP